MASPRKARRYLPLLVYVALLAIGIPWYWPDADRTLLLGMPAWVVVAITSSLIASVYTTYLLHTSWPEGSGSDR